MIWHYRCPMCGKWRPVPWDDRNVRRVCHNSGEPYVPPGPAEQYDGYVDTHQWPVEMDRVVIALRGQWCTVPGCNRRAQTLDHRIAWSRGGHTSVENLYPMCEEHNQEKSDTPYLTWLLLNFPDLPY